MTCRYYKTWLCTAGPSSASARRGCTSTWRMRPPRCPSCRSTRRTASTARRATSSARRRISTGLCPRAAAGPRTLECERPLAGPREGGFRDVPARTFRMRVKWLQGHRVKWLQGVSHVSCALHPASSRRLSSSGAWAVSVCAACVCGACRHLVMHRRGGAASLSCAPISESHCHALPLPTPTESPSTAADGVGHLGARAVVMADGGV
mmetsp:Transcript_14678/g.47986  ORF Transcript_14678/g.47986 Transcript_14678/m.47986 type:complete len:207 (+) Transcript_14678:1633-2253(+)